MPSSSYAIPYTVLSCSTRSKEHPPTLLTEGDGRNFWKTDLPTNRCILMLDLGCPHDVTHITVATGLCTHIEVRATRDEDEKQDKAVIVKRQEIVSMYRHKRSMSLTTSISRTPSTIDQVSATNSKPVELLVDKAAGRYVRYLEFNVLCMWEPVQRVGAESIDIKGEVSLGPPSPVYTPKPIVVPPKPIATAPPKEIAPPAAKTGEPYPSSTYAAKPFVPPADEMFPVSFGVSSPAEPPPTTAAAVPKASPQKEAKAAPTNPLQGFTLVLSGYQNPLRSEIRDKAISLGAKVQTDWTPACTHLICVAPSTPKFLEAKKSGHGAIVSKDWVLDSWNKKKRMPESDYVVGGGGILPDDGDEPPSKKFRAVM